MIKVIERCEPKLITAFVFEWKCERCGSTFQFEEEDCTESYDRFSPILHINCPVCGKATDSTSNWKVVEREISSY